MSRFFVNPQAVLFHDQLDKRNNYHTVVYNPKTESYLKINSSSYKILRTIDEKPGVTLSEISNILEGRKDVIEKFILMMLGQNVIFSK